MFDQFIVTFLFSSSKPDCSLWCLCPVSSHISLLISSQGLYLETVDGEWKRRGWHPFGPGTEEIWIMDCLFSFMLIVFICYSQFKTINSEGLYLSNARFQILTQVGLIYHHLSIFSLPSSSATAAACYPFRHIP